MKKIFAAFLMIILTQWAVEAKEFRDCGSRTNVRLTDSTNPRKFKSNQSFSSSRSQNQNGNIIKTQNRLSRGTQ